MEGKMEGRMDRRKANALPVGHGLGVVRKELWKEGRQKKAADLCHFKSKNQRQKKGSQSGLNTSKRESGGRGTVGRERVAGVGWGNQN